jgi:serine/threonine-protein kinase
MDPTLTRPSGTTATASPGVPAAESLPAVPGYEVLDLVGRGGMGRVYRARHLALGRVVALKLLLREADDRLLARFREEARAVARLQHPNIAQLYEAGTADGLPYLAQEFIDGGTLSRRIAGEPQPPKYAAATLELLARAVHFSHTQGILHRDLKPGNILLTTDGTPKVADFGLAKVTTATGGETPPDTGGDLTRTGEPLGTPAYMPPEQASGVVTTIGPAADVYGLGAILYELLTGRPPFQAPDVVQTLALVLTHDPVSPRVLQPKLPRDLDTICLKCLEKSPRKRYASAADLADDLGRFLRGEPIVARPVGKVERAAKWARRNKALAALLVVSLLCVLVLIGSAVALWVGNSRLQTALKEANEATTRERAATAEARDSLAFANAVVDRMLVRLADELAPVPQAEPVRRAFLEDARGMYRLLADTSPADERGRGLAAHATAKLATVYRQLGQLDEAAAAARQAVGMYAALTADFPADPSYRLEHAGLLVEQAVIDGQAGEWDRCGQALAAAKAVLDALPPEVRDGPEALDKYGFLHNQDGLMHMRARRVPEAAAAHRAALAVRLKVLAARPDRTDARANAAASRSNLGGALVAQNKPAEAAPEFDAAARLLDGLPGPRHALLRANVVGNMAVAAEAAGDRAAAERGYKAAVAAFAKLATDFPAVPEYRARLAHARVNAAILIGMTLGRPAEGLAFVRAARGDLEGLVKEHPKDPTYPPALDRCRKVIGYLEADLKGNPS